MSIQHQTAFCIGCRACQQACQDYHDLPAGKLLMEITERESFCGGTLRVVYEMDVCRQCGRPACLNACPHGAISRSGQGVVLISEAACTGCGACARACPFHKIVTVERAGKQQALKCQECVERPGGRSICQEACPLSCIERVVSTD